MAPIHGRLKANNMQYRVFTNGDQVWLSKRSDQTVTVKLLTHDGLAWEEGDTVPLRSLQGFEKVLHQVQVALITFILKILG